jgi:hypothetical protein
MIMITDAVQTIVGISLLETWADDHLSRFFDLGYTSPEWEITLFPEAGAIPTDDSLGGWVSFSGSSMLDVVDAALNYLKAVDTTG